MSFSRYPEYKDSGVEWLGEVPAHWSVRRLKQVCQVFPSNVDKKSYDDEDPVLLCNYTDVYYNEEIVRGMDFMAATASRVQVEKFTLLMGDTIITKDSETADDIAISAYVPETLPGVICGYHLSVVRPMAGAYGRFVKSLFDSQYLKARFAVSANGLTRVGLSQYALDNVDIPFPPMEEQKTIAQFIDAESLKIDGLIAEQKKLIALLKEKRQAVISHAVTKGLDPSAPMRDSGIEWIGKVPAHWTVCALSYRYEVALGKMLDEKRISGEHLGPYLRNADVQWGRINTDDLPQMDFKGEDLVRYSVRAGDLLVCEGGEVGRAAVWEGQLTPCFYQKALHRLRARDAGLDVARYFYFALVAAAGLEVFSGSEGKATIAHLPAEAFRRYRFAFPPLEEQAVIAKHLISISAKMHDLVAEAEQGIELLKERRSALISAAVTGKIDVRRAAAAEAA